MWPGSFLARREWPQIVYFFWTVYRVLRRYVDDNLAKPSDIVIDFGAGTGGLSELWVRASTLKLGPRVPLSVTLVDVDAVPLSLLIYGIRLWRLPLSPRIRFRAEPRDDDQLSKQLAEAINKLWAQRQNRVSVIPTAIRQRYGQLTDAVFLRHLWEQGKLEVVVSDVRARLKKAAKSSAKKRYKIGVVGLVDPPWYERKSVYSSGGWFAPDVIAELVKHGAATIVYVDSRAGHKRILELVPELKAKYMLVAQYKLYMSVQYPGRNKAYSDTRDMSRVPYIRRRSCRQLFTEMPSAEDPAKFPEKASVLGTKLKLPPASWRPDPKNIKKEWRRLWLLV